MVCAFTGYRPEKFAFGDDETHPDCVRLRGILLREIRRLCDLGFTDFLSGMAMGTDLWCAEAVLSLRDQGLPVRLTAVLPHPEQTRSWPEHWAVRHRAVLARADESVTVSPCYTRACMELRNHWLVDHADLVLAVYSGKPGGTAHTIDYAARKGLDLMMIHPEAFHVLRLTKEEQTELPL